jgi:hypothetical protein
LWLYLASEAEGCPRTATAVPPTDVVASPVRCCSSLVMVRQLTALLDAPTATRRRSVQPRTGARRALARHPHVDPGRYYRTRTLLRRSWLRQRACHWCARGITGARRPVEDAPEVVLSSLVYAVGMAARIREAGPTGDCRRDWPIYARGTMASCALKR